MKAAQIAASLDVPIYAIDAGGVGGASEEGEDSSPLAAKRVYRQGDAAGRGENHARPVLSGRRYGRLT